MQRGAIVGILIIAVIAVVVGIAKFPGGDVKSGTALIKDAADGAMLNVQITDLATGTGPAVKAGDTVTVNYVGTLESGAKFDSSYDRGIPFEFSVGAGDVIRGWDEGLVGMQVGGKRKLVIPPTLAYGEKGIGNVIPENATLTFEIELLKIN
jgi:FKBP-type peptidyl-prolyl cis-trans isomerase